MIKAHRIWKLSRVASVLTAFVLTLTTSGAVRSEVIRSDESNDLKKTGVPLYEWKDSKIKEPKCVVVAIHGAAQQGGALDALARSLAALGYLVVAPDLRGAGRWNTLTHQKSAGAFGDFVRSCDDLSTILKVLRKEHPKSDFFCIGESAGSTVVLSAMVRDASRVKGIILCSAGSEPKLHSPGTMGPEFYKKLMHVTTPVDMSEFIGHYSSDDSRVTAEMINDPLGRNKLSALELVGTFNFIQQGSVLAAQIPKTLSTLLIQGREDQIINPNSAVKMLGKLDCTDKNLLMLPGCGHILIGTSFLKPVVEENIVQWLSDHGGIKSSISNRMPPNAPDFQKQSRAHSGPFGGYQSSGTPPVGFEHNDHLQPAPGEQFPPSAGERVQSARDEHTQSTYDGSTPGSETRIQPVTDGSGQAIVDTKIQTKSDSLIQPSDYATIPPAQDMNSISPQPVGSGSETPKEQTPVLR